jgi:uncharacterized protein YjiS (DUF1127 family)
MEMEMTLSEALFAIPGRRTGMLSRLVARRELARQRARLAELDEHLLRDIGLSRAEALAEAALPNWDPPDWWRCE